jgi:hypothetical protein
VIEGLLPLHVAVKNATMNKFLEDNWEDGCSVMNLISLLCPYRRNPGPLQLGRQMHRGIIECKVLQYRELLHRNHYDKNIVLYTVAAKLSPQILIERLKIAKIHVTVTL